MARGAPAPMVDLSAIGGMFRKLFFFSALLLIIAFFSAGPLMKWAVVHYGEAATGSQVKLAELTFNPFAGKIGLKDFYVYNPIGFTNAPAIYVGTLEVRIKPGSILSNHIVVEDIVVENPEILFEGGLKRSNLTVLQQNVQDYINAMMPETATISEDPNAEPTPPREYSIDRLMITNPSLRVSTQVVDKQVTITMQDIVMTDIGKGGTDAGTLFASMMQPFMNIVNTSVGANLGAFGARLKDNAMGINNAINDLFRGSK